jgi:tRNA A-37 threonylcarbamoyl transferase component Bud32
MVEDSGEMHTTAICHGDLSPGKNITMINAFES